MWVAGFDKETEDKLLKIYEEAGEKPDLSIGVHEKLEDWDMQSYGFTAGRLEPGTPVEVLHRRNYQMLEYGERNKPIMMVKIRGGGIEGWVTPWTIQEVK